MFRIAFMVALLAAVPAMAQEAAPCVKRSDFLKHLSTNYDEAPVAMGVTASGRVLEITASDNGSWTIIVTMPNGISCGIASGESWENVLPPVSKGPKA
ncbi:MAG: hypothetical protein ACE5H8_03180 [Alphaproteobacteria bacterium]